MKNKRTLSNILRHPHQQLRASIRLSSTIALIFSSFIIVNLNFLHRTVVALASDAQLSPDTVEALNRSFTVMMGATAVFAVLSILAGLLLGFSMTARIFGPIVPIRRLISQYTQGNYKARAYLRKHDEFQDLMQDLNALGAALEERHARQT